MEDVNIDLKIAIEQAKFALQEQYDSVKNIKDHQKSLLSSVSIIIAVFGLILKNLNNEIIVSLPEISVIGFLFLIIIFIYSFSIMPINLLTPIKMDYEIFEKIIFNKPEKKILENLLHNYIEVLELNSAKIDRLIIRSKISTAAYIMIILTFFVIIINAI